MGSAASRTQQGRKEEHSVKTLRSPLFAKLEELCIEWRNSTPRCTSTSKRRNRNINLNKYFIC